MTNFFLILLNLLLISSYSKAEFYSEHYGEIEVSSTIFLEDIEGDNRKNFLNSTNVEYNYFFEKDNLNPAKFIRKAGKLGPNQICID